MTIAKSVVALNEIRAYGIADIPMPEAGMAVNVDEALEIANKIGYPVMVRPSTIIRK